MKRTRITLGIVLACFLLPPLIIGGLLKAGHYTFVAKTLPPWRCQWYLGPTDVMVNYSPMRGYRLTLNKYDLAAYRPQDVPVYHRYYGSRFRPVVANLALQMTTSEGRFFVPTG